jgi:hypothetical protein
MVLSSILYLFAPDGGRRIGVIASLARCGGEGQTIAVEVTRVDFPPMRSVTASYLLDWEDESLRVPIALHHSVLESVTA